MKNMATKTRVRLMSVVLFSIVFTVWAVFLFLISLYIADSAKKQMTQAAEQIVERIGGEFSRAERLLGSLTKNEDIKALMASRSPDGFYSLAGATGKILDSGSFNPDFIESIIIYGTDGHYYRLAGRLDNTSCARLAGVIYASSLPSHLAVTLKQQNYIGYADTVLLNDEKQPGTVVMLIEEAKILEILRTYDQSGSLLIEIKAGGAVVAANTDRTDSFGGKIPVIHSRLGITPYEISVAADKDYMNASVWYFRIVALISAGIFGFVIYMYADIMNKRFFRPMVSTMESIENLNTDVTTETLSHVNSREFDSLIDKINEMLMKLETKNKAVKSAEVERQKALLSSLKKQISVHFTINTLNTVKMLIEQGDYELAQAVTDGLTSLFRYAYDKDELINIWDEIDILQDYVLIMNNRYGGKLKADFDFDDRLMKYSIPRMLLQPVIENAVVHGFKGICADCVITVKAQPLGDMILFSIQDNGCGMSGDELRQLQEKLSAGLAADTARGFENIALLNIRNRIYHYCGDAGKLEITSAPGAGTIVSIIISPMA